MTIAPGIFGTPMIFGMPQEVQDSLAASIPFPRAPWAAGRLRQAGTQHHHQRHAERRNHPPGWRHPHAAQVNPRISLAFPSCFAMSLLRSAATVSSFTLLSRIAGLIRDVLVARALWRRAADGRLLGGVPHSQPAAPACSPKAPSPRPSSPSWGRRAPQPGEEQVRTLLDRVALLLTCALMLVTLVGIALAPWVVHRAWPAACAARLARRRLRRGGMDDAADVPVTSFACPWLPSPPAC